MNQFVFSILKLPISNYSPACRNHSASPLQTGQWLRSVRPNTNVAVSHLRYPTKEWHRHHLGTFNASFHRTIQSFQTTQSTNYLKYVKFELLDFHGHEHYCPLSVVRIHGSNVEDEIMTMEDNTNLKDLKSSADIPDDNDNEDEDNNNLSNDQQVGGIIGSAILDLAKRVFRRQTIRGTPSTTTTTSTEPNALKDSCDQSSRHDVMNNSSMKSWRRSGIFKRCIARFLRGLWSKADTCIVYLLQICFQSNYCCQCPLSAKGNRNRVTLNFYLHPCGYYHVLTNQFICKKEKSIRLNETISSPPTLLNGEILQDLTEKNLTINQTGTTVINEKSNTSNRVLERELQLSRARKNLPLAFASKLHPCYSLL